MGRKELGCILSPSSDFLGDTGEDWAFTSFSCSSAGSPHVCSSGSLWIPNSPQPSISSKNPRLSRLLHLPNQGKYGLRPTDAKLRRYSVQLWMCQRCSSIYMCSWCSLTLNTIGNIFKDHFKRKHSDRLCGVWDRPQFLIASALWLFFQIEPSEQGLPKIVFEGKSSFQKEQIFPLKNWILFETSS